MFKRNPLFVLDFLYLLTSSSILRIFKHEMLVCSNFEIFESSSELPSESVPIASFFFRISNRIFEIFGPSVGFLVILI